MGGDHPQLPCSNVSLSSPAAQGLSPLRAEKGRAPWLPAETCGYESSIVRVYGLCPWIRA